jgi:hypothetical protein
MYRMQLSSRGIATGPENEDEGFHHIPDTPASLIRSTSGWACRRPPSTGSACLRSNPTRTRCSTSCHWRT